MIVSVILCGLMSIVILFFVITNNGFSAVSIFYGLFLMFIYGGMTFSENKRKGSGTIYRRIFLTTYAVFFCIGFTICRNGNFFHKNFSFRMPLFFCLF